MCRITATALLLVVLSGCGQKKDNIPATEPIIPVTKSIDSSNQQTEKDPVENTTIGYAPVNGINLYYEIHGEGQPLVLIHGGGSTITTSFGKLLPLLADRYKVIAVELQAHGHTNDRTTPSSFEQDADDVAALLNHLKIDKAALLGFSNGGNIAMQVAIRHPELADKLVVISAFYKRNGLVAGFFDTMKNASLSNMPDPLKAAFLKINDDTAALQAMHDRDKNRMLNFKDWPDTLLKSIKIPVLLMAADKDVVTPAHVLDMSHKIPTTELVILPGVHGSFIGEICTSPADSKWPAITAAIVSNFLGK